MRLIKHALRKWPHFELGETHSRSKEVGLQTEVSKTSLKMSIIKTGAIDHMPVKSIGRGMNIPKISETICKLGKHYLLNRKRNTHTRHQVEDLV